MIGKVLAKLGRGETLSAMEIQQLEKFGDEVEFSRSFAGGIQSGQGDILANEVRANRGVFSLIDIIVKGVRTGQIDGDLFLGEDLTDPAKSGFHFFATAQTYNSESMGAGDILIGDNSSAKPNLFWDASVPALYHRQGTTIVSTLTGTQSYAPVGASVSSGAETASTATLTVMTGDTEQWDDADFWEGVTNPTRFTAPQDGTYEFTGWIAFAENATGRREQWFKIDGSTYAVAGQQNAVTGQQTVVLGQREIDLSATDYVEHVAYQNSGGDLSINGKMIVRRIR